MEQLLELYHTMGVSPAVYAYGEKTVEKLQERFAVNVEIAILAGENLEGQALFDAMAKIRGSLLEELPKAVLKPKPLYSLILSVLVESTGRSAKEINSLPPVKRA